MNLIDRLYVAIMMLAGRGIVQCVNDEGGVQVMQVQFGANETIDGIRSVKQYGFTSVPKPGSHAIAIFLRGDRSSGVVLGTNDLSSRLKGLQSGEVAIYDDQGQKVHLTRSGIVITGKSLALHADNSLKLDCGGNGFEWTPTTRVDYSIGSTASSEPLNPPQVP